MADEISKSLFNGNFFRQGNISTEAIEYENNSSRTQTPAMEELDNLESQLGSAALFQETEGTNINFLMDNNLVRRSPSDQNFNVEQQKLQTKRITQQLEMPINNIGGRDVSNDNKDMINSRESESNRKKGKQGKHDKGNIIDLENEPGYMGRLDVDKIMEMLGEKKGDNSNEKSSKKANKKKTRKEGASAFNSNLNYGQTAKPNAQARGGDLETASSGGTAKSPLTAAAEVQQIEDMEVDVPISLDNDAVVSIDKKVDNGAVVSSDKAADNDAVVSSDKAVDNDAVVSSDKAVDNDAVVSSNKAADNDAVVSSEKKVDNDVIVSSDKAVDSDAIVSSDKAVDSDAIVSNDKKQNTMDEKSPPKSEKLPTPTADNKKTAVCITIMNPFFGKSRQEMKRMSQSQKAALWETPVELIPLKNNDVGKAVPTTKVTDKAKSTVNAVPRKPKQTTNAGAKKKNLR